VRGCDRGTGEKRVHRELGQEGGESRGDGDGDVRLRRWDSQRGGEHEKSGKKGIARERESGGFPRRE
jgi:hypothetical protein